MLVSESMDVLDNCDDGNFRREDFDMFEWKACAYKLEIDDGAVEQIGEQLMSTLSGSMGLNFMDTDSLSDDQARLLTGNSIFGRDSHFPPTTGGSSQKVRLEITWEDGSGEQSMVVERFVTSFGVNQNGTPPPRRWSCVTCSGADVNRRPTDMERGFTLIEVMIALVLLLIVSLSTQQALTTSFEIKDSVTSINERHHEARQTLSRMSREIRMAFIRAEVPEQFREEKPAVMTRFFGEEDELIFASTSHLQRSERIDGSRIECEIAYFLKNDSDSPYRGKTLLSQRKHHHR